SAVDLQGPRPRPVRAAAGASGNAGRRDAPSGRAHAAGLERGGCAVLGRVPVAALTARRGWETVASGFAGVLPVTLHPGSSALRPALPLTPIGRKTPEARMCLGWQPGVPISRHTARIRAFARHNSQHANWPN